MKKKYTLYFSHYRAWIGLICAGLGSVIILLGIFSGYIETGSKGKKDLFIIDISLSMAVEDVFGISPIPLSRLELAKNIIGLSYQNTDEIALITYAKTPLLLSPFTRDKKYILSLLDTISHPEVGGGSDLPLALSFAKGLYSDEYVRVIVFTDGGSTSTTLLPRIPIGWDVTFIGIGSENGGPIPLGYNANGEKRYKYFSGSEIVIPYDKKNIEKYASTLGAKVKHIKHLSSYIPPSRHSFFLYKHTPLTLAIILILIGLILHPYAKKYHP